MQIVNNYIGGEFTPSVSGQSFTHSNPMSGSPQAAVASSSQLDLVRAIQAANKAGDAWRKLDARTRAGFLKKIADKLEERRQEIALLQALDQGTPIQAGEKYSLPAAWQAFQYCADELIRDHSMSVSSSHYNAKRTRLPIGTVALIASWSDSVALISMRLAAALAAGNCVIVKLSEFAPQSGSALASICEAVGLPPGVVSFLHGKGSEVGSLLALHPAITTISFIGRNETAKSLIRDSAEQLKRLHLALSAKNPVLVFAETDLEAAAKEAALICAGAYPAACLRGSRLFVQESIYEQFLPLLKASLEALKSGDPTDRDTQIGCLPSQEHVSLYSKALQQGLNERGKLLCGGPRQTPLESNHPADRLTHSTFVQPTALYDFTLCSTLQQEEVIGPLVTIASFKYQHDAIKHANNNPYARACYLFHSQSEKAQRIAAKIEASQIFLNSGPLSMDSGLGFTGMKQSGQSPDGVSALLGFFSRESTIIHKFA